MTGVCDLEREGLIPFWVQVPVYDRAPVLERMALEFHIWVTATCAERVYEARGQQGCGRSTGVCVGGKHVWMCVETITYRSKSQHNLIPRTSQRCNSLKLHKNYWQRRWKA